MPSPRHPECDQTYPLQALKVLLLCNPSAPTMKQPRLSVTITREDAALGYALILIRPRSPKPDSSGPLAVDTLFLDMEYTDYKRQTNPTTTTTAPLLQPYSPFPLPSRLLSILLQRPARPTAGPGHRHSLGIILLGTF